MNPRPQSPYLAIAALATMVLIFGYNWVVMKVALRYAEPFVFAFIRCFLAAAFLFILLAAFRKPLRPRHLCLTLAVGVFGIAGSLGLAIWALKSGGAGKTAVLTYTMPIWLLVLSRVTLGERIRGLQWLSVVLAVAGLVLVLEPWGVHGTPFSSILGLASGICSAAAALLGKFLMQRDGVDILSVNAWQLLLGSIPLVVVASLVHPAWPVWTGVFIAALLFNVVLASAVALLLWFYALKVLPAGTVGLASLGTPVVGVASAWMQLGERPNRFELGGVVLILTALTVIAMRGVIANRQARGLTSRSTSPASRVFHGERGGDE